MGNTTDFIRGGYSVTFNNGLHGWAGGTRDIHTDECTEGRLTKHRQQEFITVRVYNSHMASIPAIWTV